SIVIRSWAGVRMPESRKPGRALTNGRPGGAAVGVGVEPGGVTQRRPERPGAIGTVYSSCFIIVSAGTPHRHRCARGAIPPRRSHMPIMRLVFSLLGRGVRRPERSARFRPQLTALENRWVPSTITEFALPPLSFGGSFGAAALTGGPDGNVWFSDPRAGAV